MKIESREQIGSNKVNKLRADKLLPGVIYKRGAETQTVQVSEPEFTRVYKVAGSTSVIDLELDGKKYPVIVKDIQKHPFRNQILHIDFQELNMDETIKMFIPLYLINRDNIKLQPSVLTQMMDEIEIECLPNNIPSSVEIDVADMTFETPIHVNDLDIVNNEDITVLTDLDTVICTLSEPSQEAEEDDLDEDLGDDVEVADEAEETEE